MVFAPSSLILANNFLPLSGALVAYFSYRVDSMKTITFVDYKKRSNLDIPKNFPVRLCEPEYLSGDLPENFFACRSGWGNKLYFFLCGDQIGYLHGSVIKEINNQVVIHEYNNGYSEYSGSFDGKLRLKGNLLLKNDKEVGSISFSDGIFNWIIKCLLLRTFAKRERETVIHFDDSEISSFIAISLFFSHSYFLN